MPSRRSRAFGSASWLMAGAFALHLAEEAPAFTSWAQRHTSARYSSGRFLRINALGLGMTVAGTAAVNRWRSHGLYLGYHTAVVTQQALFNPVFHAGTTIVYGEYSPGLVTSLTLFWPLWWQITRAALREQRLSRAEVIATGVLAGAMHAAAVAEQVYLVDVRGAVGRLSSRLWH